MHRFIALFVPILLWGGAAAAGETPPPKPPPVPSPTAEEIPGLIASMAKDDFAGKQASERLAAAGEAAVVPLIRATRHKTPRVRYWSISVLSSIGDKLLRKGFNQHFAFDEEAPLTERHRAIRQWRTWFDANKKQLVWNKENQRFDIAVPETPDDKQ